MWLGSLTLVCVSIPLCSSNVRHKNSRSLTLLREDSLMGKDWCPQWRLALLWVYLTFFTSAVVANLPTVVTRV